MRHEQITNGFKEAKENLEKSLQFFNDMMSHYCNIESRLYEKCKDSELATVRQELYELGDIVYWIEETLNSMKRINIDIDYEL